MKQELINCNIKFTIKDTNIRELLLNKYSFVDKLYSYVAYNNNGNITIIAHISQVDDYNTIPVTVMIFNIISSLHGILPQGIFCYGQPPLDILVEVLQPLINKLVNIQYRKWRQFTYADLYQMCSCKLCELYYKGYYIHKQLLSRAFENSVYQLLRKEPRDITFVSSDAQIKTSDDTLSVVDMIPDVQQELEQADKEDNVALSQIYNEERDIIIDIIGQRQYDQLLREFRTHTLSNATSRLLQRIRNNLQKLGYNKDYWQKYFE